VEDRHLTETCQVRVPGSVDEVNPLPSKRLSEWCWDIVGEDDDLIAGRNGRGRLDPLEQLWECRWPEASTYDCTKPKPRTVRQEDLADRVHPMWKVEELLNRSS
jgi:hypothetical protein